MTVTVLRPHRAGWDLEVILGNYLKHLNNSGLAFRTKEEYERQVRSYLAWLKTTDGAHEPFLDAVGAAGAVAEWKRHRLYELKLSASSINQGISAVDLLYSILKIRLDVKRVAVPDPGEPTSLTPQQESALKRAAERGTNPRIQAVETALIYFMLGTGGRLEEVTRLTLEDISLTARRGWVTFRGKGDTIRRVTIPSPTPLEKLKLYLDSRVDPLDELWIGARGRPLTRRGIQDMVRRLGHAAKIESLSPHDLRHTCARKLMEAGEDLAVIQKFLGHSSVKTTGRYVRPSEERVARNIDAILG